MLDVEIKDCKFLCHMNMAESHISQYSGIFECEGKPLHGKKFIKECETEVKGFMQYGKTKYMYYLDEPNSETFTTLNKLVRYYNSTENKSKRGVKC